MSNIDHGTMDQGSGDYKRLNVAIQHTSTHREWEHLRRKLEKKTKVHEKMIDPVQKV